MGEEYEREEGKEEGGRGEEEKVEGGRGKGEEMKEEERNGEEMERGRGKGRWEADTNHKGAHFLWVCSCVIR